MCYFPETENMHSAVNHLMRWINRCKPLREKLEASGYSKHRKWFSPCEVALIVEYLGAP